MNKKIPRFITLAAIIGFLAIAGNTAYTQTTDPLLTGSVDQSEFPQIRPNRWTRSFPSVRV